MHLRKTALGLILLILIGNAAILARQLSDNVITFDNQSGEPAVVKILGPSTQRVDLPAKEKRMLQVAAGRYDVILRYGGNAQSYRYVRANSFSIDDSASFLRVTITLTADAVLLENEGRFPMRPSSRDEFEKVTADRSFPFSVENTSNDVALVRLEGPVTLEFPVAARSTATAQISVGVYLLKVRYGEEGRYRYFRQATAVELDPWRPAKLDDGRTLTPIFNPDLPPIAIVAKLPVATPLSITVEEFHRK